MFTVMKINHPTFYLREKTQRITGMAKISFPLTAVRANELLH